MQVWSGARGRGPVLPPLVARFDPLGLLAPFPLVCWPIPPPLVILSCVPPFFGRRSFSRQRPLHPCSSELCFGPPCPPPFSPSCCARHTARLVCFPSPPLSSPAPLSPSLQRADAAGGPQREDNGGGRARRLPPLRWTSPAPFLSAPSVSLSRLSGEHIPTPGDDDEMSMRSPPFPCPVPLCVHPLFPLPPSCLGRARPTAARRGNAPLPPSSSTSSMPSAGHDARGAVARPARLLPAEGATLSQTHTHHQHVYRKEEQGGLAPASPARPPDNTRAPLFRLLAAPTPPTPPPAQPIISLPSKTKAVLPSTAPPPKNLQNSVPCFSFLSGGQQTWRAGRQGVSSLSRRPILFFPLPPVLTLRQQHKINYAPLAPSRPPCLPARLSARLMSPALFCSLPPPLPHPAAKHARRPAIPLPPLPPGLSSCVAPPPSGRAATWRGGRCPLWLPPLSPLFSLLGEQRRRAWRGRRKN